MVSSPTILVEPCTWCNRKFLAAPIYNSLKTRAFLNSYNVIHPLSLCECSRRIYPKVYDLLPIRQKFIESSRSMRYLLKILSLTFQKRESTIWEQMFHLSLMAWGYHDKDQKYSFYFFSLPTSKWFHFLILYNINYIPASIISLKSHLQ